MYTDSVLRNVQSPLSGISHNGCNGNTSRVETVSLVSLCVGLIPSSQATQTKKSTGASPRGNALVRRSQRENSGEIKSERASESALTI
jgi:hypothetical protein